MPETPPEALDVVRFWREAGPKKWFEKSKAFDDDFRGRFLNLHDKAARGELADWMGTAEGALALILLLDQFPRNCFRNSTRMYATDPLARKMARQAVADGRDMQVEKELRVFFYLPFSHSETLADHAIPVEKGKALGGDYEKHAIGHRDIVEKFGRFPHRNAILGRETTPEEQAFLDDGGFKG